MDIVSVKIGERAAQVDKEDIVKMFLEEIERLDKHKNNRVNV